MLPETIDDYIQALKVLQEDVLRALSSDSISLEDRAELETKIMETLMVSPSLVFQGLQDQVSEIPEADDTVEQLPTKNRKNLNGLTSIKDNVN